MKDDKKELDKKTICWRKKVRISIIKGTGVQVGREKKQKPDGTETRNFEKISRRVRNKKKEKTGAISGENIYRRTLCNRPDLQLTESRG